MNRCMTWRELFLLFVFVFVTSYNAEADWNITVSDGDTHVSASWDDVLTCIEWSQRIQRTTELNVVPCFWLDDERVSYED